MKTAAIFLLLPMLFLDVVAQDTHYWTHQYGTSSVLLGGAVVGGIKNSTAAFYNPASLGFVDTASLSINASAYQSENIKVENALGQTKDFKSNYLSVVPLMLGGMFRSGVENRLKIAYGIVSPIDFNFNATARIDNPVEIVNNDSPGPEDFIAQAAIASKMRETSVAIALGRKFNDHWSIGLSNLFIVRSQDFQKVQYARMYLNDIDQTLVTTSFSRIVKFYNVRYVAKLGLAYQSDHFSAGVSVNSPSLNLFGNGTIAVDILGTNILTATGRRDFLGNDRQEKLKSKYKSPVSLAGGINYDWRRSHIGISAQYFGKINVYDVLRADSSAFVRPADLNKDLTSDQYLRVKSGARPVFNIVVGYQYMLSPAFSLVGSARTDNSFHDPAVSEAVGIKTELSTWNIYHFTLGGIVTKGRSQLSFGLLISTGKDDSKKQDGVLDNPSEGNFLQGSTTIVKAKYSCIGLMVGYNFSFKKF